MPQTETPPLTTQPSATPPRARRLLLIFLVLVALLLLIPLATKLYNWPLNQIVANFEQRGGTIRRAPVSPVSQAIYWIKKEFFQNRVREWSVNDNDIREEWEQLQNTGDVVSLKGAPLKPDEVWILSRLPIHDITLPDTPLSQELIAALEKRPFGLMLCLPDSHATDESLNSLCNALAQCQQPILLELGHTAITNDGAQALKRIPNLVAIGLESHHIDGTILRHLASLPIRNLSLPGCNITDQDIPNLIRDFPGLNCLDLSRTKLTPKGLLQLAVLTSLRYVHLDDLPVTDEVLAGFAHLPLSELSLARTQVTDAAVALLGKKQQFFYLNLAGTKVTKAPLKAYLNSNYYGSNSKLILADTNLDDSTFELIYQMTTLSELDLSGTKITDRFLDRLNSSGLSELRTLIIKRTNTTPKLIPAVKKAHPRLRIISDFGVH